MTAQCPDSVRIDETTYDLTAHHGGDLWRPESAGVPVVMASTACWRGYVCTYAVVDGHLVLDQLDAMVGRYDADDNFIPVALPAIHGRAGHAKKVGEGQMFNAEYRDLAVPVPFTGELVVGAARRPGAELDLEASPWGYQQVVRLRCAAGAVTGRDDVSTTIAQVRTALAAADEAGAQAALAGAALTWLSPRLRYAG